MDGRRRSKVKGEEITPGMIKKGQWFRSTEAWYYEQPCEVAMKIDRWILEDNDVEMGVFATGTSNEKLLEYLSG